MERIDVHAHCVPPAYREYCLKNDFAGRGHPDGMPAIPVSAKWPKFDDRMLTWALRTGMRSRIFSWWRTWISPSPFLACPRRYTLDSGQWWGSTVAHSQCKRRHVKNLLGEQGSFLVFRITPSPRCGWISSRNWLRTWPSRRRGLSNPDQFARNIPGRSAIQPSLQ